MAANRNPGQTSRASLEENGRREQTPAHHQEGSWGGWSPCRGGYLRVGVRLDWTAGDLTSDSPEGTEDPGFSNDRVSFSDCRRAMYRVTVQLNHAAQVLPSGHGIRVSISTSYWPLVSPPPQPVRLDVHAGASRLHLPCRPSDPADDALHDFEEPEGAAGSALTMVQPEHHDWLVHRDLGH
jgi:hypothetical protein